MPETISRQKVKDLLHGLGIRPGDMIMVHSAFSALAGMEGGAEGLIQAMQEVIGPEGTLVMPSFNWDILHQGDEIIFDLANTPSNMGYLTEYFRTRPGTLRSRNLFNPIIATGRRAADLTACPNHSTWDTDSPLHLMYQAGAKVVLLGADFNSVTMIHYAEQLLPAPYRFKYIFPNAWLLDEDGAKTPLHNHTLRRKDGFEIDFNRIEPLVEEAGLVRQGELGQALVRVMDARELVDLLLARMRENPYLLVRDEPHIRKVRTRTEGAFHPKGLVQELWLLNRALVSDGYDQALNRLAELVPLKINAYPTGSKALDWTIPDKWSNNGGGIYDLEGNLLVDLGAHPLHIAAGSIPFSGELSADELMERIAVHDDNPEAIPYAICYYNPTWAICLSRQQRDQLIGERFRVEINTSLDQGHLKVGEVRLPGQVDEYIVMPIHLDHPGQCNDNLSGVAVAVDLIRRLGDYQGKYGLLFLFLPETIGSYAWLDRNQEMIPKLKWGLVFDSVGAGGELGFMNTVSGDTVLDQCTRLSLDKVTGGRREWPFLSLFGYGNDERAFMSPGVRVPTVSLSRYPYPQYHSSLDTPDIMDVRLLRETRQVIQELIHTLNRNYVPRLTVQGIPQLGPRGLWPDWREDPKGIVALEKFMFTTDGRKSLAELALEEGVSFDFTLNLFDAFIKHGLACKVDEQPPAAPIDLAGRALSRSPRESFTQIIARSRHA